MSEVLSILMVDDHPENIIALKSVLEELNCNLISAYSGMEALRLLLKHDVALILLDVQMPVMDGFEVAELMRKNPRTQHIPIIFITAINKDDKFVARGYEVGAIDYLFKPYNPDILQKKARFFLDLHEQKRRIEEKLKLSQASREAFLKAMGTDNIESLTNPNKIP